MPYNEQRLYEKIHHSAERVKELADQAQTHDSKIRINEVNHDPQLAHDLTIALHALMGELDYLHRLRFDLDKMRDSAVYWD